MNDRNGVLYLFLGHVGYVAERVERFKTQKELSTVAVITLFLGARLLEDALANENRDLGASQPIRSEISRGPSSKVALFAWGRT